ncbi:MAG: carboxymuconolactone decarboxylase family protein [Flavobacteriales bacterium]|jgi:alkyl hydroperoxide reductase subunit D|nr:carboxymuconolactone decarboxylase family protein [Flavobacteriales bacterium]MCI1753253.1 carboxymuconolactone decarboxylase family protein [Flavobacteriales bacterium]
MAVALTAYEEGTASLLEEVGLPAGHANSALQLLGAVESRYSRDLKLNLKAVLKSTHLSDKETALLALSIAANQKNGPLSDHFNGLAAQCGATPEECAEAVACASLLAANNVLYRFRHFADKEKYNELRPSLRMNIMMNPVTGKHLFELMSLAVSAVNGCEQCVKSHEASLIGLGATEEQVWDAIRIASVVASYDRIVH